MKGKEMLKKLICFCLAVSMIISAVPANEVFAGVVENVHEEVVVDENTAELNDKLGDSIEEFLEEDDANDEETSEEIIKENLDNEITDVLMEEYSSEDNDKETIEISISDKLESQEEILDEDISNEYIAGSVYGVSVNGPFDWGEDKIADALEELLNDIFKPNTFYEAKNGGKKNIDVIPDRGLGEKSGNNVKIYCKYPERGNKIIGSQATCVAFANTVFYRIFGNVSYTTKRVESWSEVVKNAQMGDLIYCYKGKDSNGKDVQHEVIFIKPDNVNSGKATYCDNNNWGSQQVSNQIHVWSNSSGYTNGVKHYEIRHAYNYADLKVPAHSHNYICTNKDTEAHCTNKNCPEEKWKNDKHSDPGFMQGDYLIKADKATKWLYSGPYSGSSPTGYTVKNGETVTMDKATINAFGNSWGHVRQKTKNGYKEGWICIKDKDESDYKYVCTKPTNEPTVKFNNMNTPKDNSTGSYSLTTVITSEGALIDSVTGKLISLSGTEVGNSSDPDGLVVKSVTVNGINSSTFNVQKSAINTGSNCLKFGSLSPGKYIYKYSVKLKGISKPIEKKSPSFIRGNAIPYDKPEIKQVKSYAGKIVYRISKQGHKVKYSVNGGSTYSEFVNSKDIEITSSTTIKAYTYAKAVSSTYSTNDLKANMYYVATPVYVRSDEVVKSVTIEKVSTPEINYSQNGNGTTVSISVGGSYNKIYYRIGNGSYMQYTKPFTITAGVTISSYAENDGMLSSNVASRSVPVSEPDTPNIVSVSKADIAEGDAITISWSKDNKAKNYTVKVKKDNEDWKTIISNTAYVAFNTEGSGVYSVSVVANNVIGSSQSSNVITTEAHNPSTVRFIDWDDSVIGTPQIVRYGYSATKPLSPKRRGYTFSGWDGQYTNVMKDTDIKAEYEINTYIVKFYDVTGNKYLGEQNITFDTSIDAEEFKSEVVTENPGRHFTGWEIYNVKDDESYLDLEHVDSDMLVRAVTTWASDTMPCLISNVSSTPITVNDEIGFRVNSTVSSTEKKDLKAKILVSLYSDRGNDVYRMIKTSTKEAMIKAGTSNTIEPIDITYNGTVKADKIMVSVVSIEGTDRTGGLIAEPKYYDVPEGSYKYYSGWITAEEAAKKGYSITGSDVQVRTTYRSRVNTRKTTGWTRSATAPEGYKLLNSVKRTGSWSSWSDSKYTSSTLRDVESKNVIVTAAHTEYRYGCWSNGAHTYWCPNSGYKAFKGSWSLKYTGWSTSRTSGNLATTENNGKLCPYNVNGCNRSSQHIGYNSSHNDSRGYACDYWSWVYHPTSSKEDYYWEETKPVSAVTKTQYRYRDNYYEYDYYTFEQGWWDNEWSENEIKEVHTSSKDMDVQQRKEYNILLGSVPPVDSTGEIMNIKGSLNDKNLSNKTAIVLIYKEKNTDPTESQIEYIGNTKLDSNGGYEFNFITKDDPNKIKSDYVVALAVEGSDNYLNIDLIRYKRNEYTVKFVVDDTVIKEVTVEEGENVEAPENINKEGYDFVGWDKNTTNIKSNLITVAQFSPKKYCIVFVDYENKICNLTTQEYGSFIAVPEDISNPVCEGLEFNGWDYEENATVLKDTVIAAKWIPETYTVKFLDAYGNTINTQENIEYGSAAVLPELNVADNMVFLGWSQDEEWWNVTKDIEIYPIVTYKNKLAAPTSNLDFCSEGEGHLLTLEATDEAEIFYTLDGTEPTEERYNIFTDEEGIVVDNTKMLDTTNFEEILEEGFTGDPNEGNCGITYKYEEPILLKNDCVIRAIAVAPEYQNSEISEFTHSMEHSEIDRGELREVAKQYAYLKSGSKISLAVDFNNIDSLYSGELLINTGDAILYPYYDENEDIGMVVSNQFTAYGDVSVNMLGEDGNIEFNWVGSDAVNNPGRMFTVELCVDENTPSGNYPISLLYVPRYTFDADCEQLNLEGKVSLVVNPEEKTDEADKKHNITYVLNGGKNASTNPSEYKEGKEVVLKDATKEGYTFEGWYTNSNFTGMKVTKISSDFTTDITLYAKFKKNKEENKEDDNEEIYGAPDDLWYRADLDNLIYSGEPIKPEISVYDGSKRLVLGKDYTVSYANNKNAASKSNAKAPSIVINGKGSYTKKYSKTFTINKKNLKDCRYLSYMTVLNNSKITPVIANNGILLKSSDYDMYRISESGSSRAIKASDKWIDDGILRLVGKGNYEGSVDINVITSSSKPKVIDVALSKDKYCYDGNPGLPPITVFEKGDKYKSSLREDIDYFIYEPDDTTNAGAHKFVVVGIGKYSGALQKSVTIYPSMTGALNAKATPSEVSFNGKGTVPENIKVTYRVTNWVDGKAEDTNTELVEGRDYTVKYSNNNSANSSAKYTVSFIGNFKGRKAETGSFYINKKKFDDAQVRVLIPDKTNCADKGVFKQSPVISVDGNKLSTKEYIITYYTDDSYTSSKEMTSSNPVYIGSEGYATVYVKIEGQGNYGGEVKASYNVFKKGYKGSSVADLSKAKVTIKNPKNVMFVNKEVEPAIDRVVAGGSTVSPSYYTVSYAVNVYKGTASLMVTGDGIHAFGSKIQTFSIGAYDVNNIKEYTPVTPTPEPEPEPTKYTVKFNVNGGVGTYADQAVEEGKKATKPSNNPTKEGYTFKYWSKTNAEGAVEYNFDTIVTGNIILYAIYEKNVEPEPEPEPTKYTVKFNVNGGVGTYADQAVEEGKTATKPVTNPTKEGYTFKYWSITNTEGAVEYNFDTIVTGNITLYAIYEKNVEPEPEPELIKYTVKFNTNGGTGTYTDQVVEEGKKATKPATNPTKEGYTFKYWSITNTEGATEYNFDTVVTGNITLYAIYEKNTEPESEPGTTKYTVKFDANGHGTAPDTLENVVKGSKITEPTEPTASGYTFGGWYKEISCINKWNFSKDSITSNVTLYAEWIESTTVASGKGTGTFEWRIDSEGCLYVSGEGDSNYSDDGPDWCRYNTQIRKAVVSSKKMTTMSYWFAKCNQLKEVKFENCDTSQVTNMHALFYECYMLSNIYFNDFDTTNVTDMGFMFNSCNSLKNIDLSKFNTTNVTTMFGMFKFCNLLKDLDLSGFKTTNVADMGCMFQYCTLLDNLNLSGVKTINVTNMESMFEENKSLRNLDLSGFNTSNVEHMIGMFNGCELLESLDLSSFNTSNCEYGMDTILEECTSLKEVKSPSSMKSGSYIAFPIGTKWHTETDNNPTNIDKKNETYYKTEGTDIASGTGTLEWKIDSEGCLYVTGKGNAPYYETPDMDLVTKLPKWCEYSDKIKYAVVSVTDTTTMTNWFATCENIKSIKFVNCDTSKVTDMSNMFYMCWDLRYLDLSGLNTENVTDMSNMFCYCMVLYDLDLSSFNTSKVTDMSGMFNYCSSVINIDLSNFNTSNVKDMISMFEDCNNLMEVDLSTFDTSKVRDVTCMFDRCLSLEELNLNSFDLRTAGANVDNMLSECDSLNKIMSPNNMASGVVIEFPNNTKWFTKTDINPCGIDKTNEVYYRNNN